MHRYKGSELAFLFLSFSAESHAVGEGKVLASSYLLLGKINKKKWDYCVGGGTRRCLLSLRTL